MDSFKKTALKLVKKPDVTVFDTKKSKDGQNTDGAVSSSTQVSSLDGRRPKSAFLSNSTVAKLGWGSSVQKKEVYIALMGVTGAGKSTFISKCTSEKVEIGESLESCTQQVRVYPFKYDKHTTVHLIDTPGFDDSRRSNVNVLGDIAAHLKDTKLDGIVYLQRINVTRFQGADVRSIRILKKLCGPDWAKNVILVTTCWEQVDKAVGDTNEFNLLSNQNFWGSLHEKGCRVKRHTNDRASAMNIIDIVHSSETPKVMPQVQEELVVMGKPLIETEVGEEAAGLKELKQTVNKELKRHQEEVANRTTAIDKAQGKRRQTLLAQIKRSQSKVDERIQQLELEYEDLKSEMQRRYDAKRMVLSTGPIDTHSGQGRQMLSCDSVEPESLRSEESEIDPEMRIVDELLKKGQKYWLETNFPEAENHFRAGAKRAEGLDGRKSKKINSKEISLKLGFCRLQQKDLHESKVIFESLLEPRKAGLSLKSLFKGLSADPFKDQIRDHARFGLAQICLCQHDFMTSERLCQGCSDIWRNQTTANIKILYVKSLQLMALIHEAKKDPTTASVFTELASTEGIDVNEKVPHMLDIEQIRALVKIEETRRLEIEREEQRLREEEEREKERLRMEREREKERLRKLVKQVTDALPNGHGSSPSQSLKYLATKRPGQTIGPGISGSRLVLEELQLRLTVKYLSEETDHGVSHDAFDKACADGNLYIVELLYDCSVHVYLRFRSGQRSALGIAIANGQQAVARRLIAWGANVEEVDVQKRTPLDLACQEGHNDIVKMLLEEGASIEGVKPVSFSDEQEAKYFGRRTPLHIAAREGHNDVVKTLLRNGALVDARASRQHTALHYAVCQGNLDVVKTLLDAGADIDGPEDLHHLGDIEFPLDHLLTSRSACPLGVYSHSTKNTLQIARLLYHQGGKSQYSAKHWAKFLDKRR